MPDNTTPPNHLQSPDSAGTQASDDGYTPADLDRLTGANLFPHLNDLPLEERLQIIKTYQFPEQWFDEEPLLALVVLRQQKPRQWFGIKAYAKARGVNV